MNWRWRPTSPLTARRRLREHGIRSRRTATKEHLKIDHIVERLSYSTIRRDFDWRKLMSFSPTRQLSLVSIMVLPRVSYWWPPIRWTLRGKTSQVGSRECCVLGVDVIWLGKNPRTDRSSVYGRHVRTDFDQCNDPFSLKIVSRRNASLLAW